MRAGGDTQIGLDALDADTMQYGVTGGHAAFDFRRLPAGQVVEIGTPRAAFTVERAGYYRVDVEDQRTTFSVRRSGRARVVTETGEEVVVPADEQLVLTDGDPTFGLTPVAALDDWDRWNEERTASFGEAPRSAAYVSEEVAGIDDLDRHGDWHEEPRYGRVWRPRDVGPDWSPYSDGRWVYDPHYEWSWVDHAPWGWAPYHYGRWVHVSNYWGWAPGPIVAAPVYTPALVAFFGAPGVSVSVNVGLPFVSWVPLGWGEPVIPWWGGAGFVGRPYWGGWGGPHVVNNVVINNYGGRFGGGYHDARRINRWQNAMVHNAVVGLDRDGFRRGGRPHRLQHARNLRPLRGDLGVRPASHSFVAREGRGRRPPERLQHRSVVATRAGRDPIHRLRAKGVDVASAPTAAPKTRVVRPRGGGAHRLAERRQRPDAAAPTLGANERQHGFDRDRRAGVNRRAMERGTPPPPPGRGNHRMDARPGRVAPERPRAMARERGFDRAPAPPRRPDGQGLGHSRPTRPEPRSAARGRRERLEQPTPAPRMPSQDETRGARRSRPRDAAPPQRLAPERRARRFEPNVRRETPAPRSERPRLERPQRTQEERRSPRRMQPAPERHIRRAPAPDVGRQRVMRNRPSPDAGRSVQRQAPRMERRVERAAPRERNGRARKHQREG